MKKIVCLGTSHTYGGANERNYTFEEGWPGQLSKYLKDNGVDNYVYNGGESSFSSFFYPTKIINFYNEYKPDMFVIEVPDTDKVDIEISSAITGHYIQKHGGRNKEPYHPIYARQRVLTQDWEKGEQYNWPNRKSISKGEAVDFYHGADTTVKIKEFFKGETGRAVQEFYESASLGDHERDNVKKKFNELYTALGRNDDNFKAMLAYCYFHSVFIDQSDFEISCYLANLMNIINTLKMLNVKFCLHSHVNRHHWLDHFIWKETYQPIIDKPDYWMAGKMDWSVKKWAYKKAESKGGNVDEEIKKMHSDKVHFHPWVYTMLVDEVFGPEILKKLK